MIADLKPYPEYRETDLPWVGAMPTHWQQRRMKFLFQERVQKGFPDKPLLAATQTKGVVRKEDYGTRTVTAQKDLHLLKLVEPGDFVISLRSFQGGIEVAHCQGIISPAYTVLAPRPETHGNYFKHFFKAPDFISSLTLFVTGIREGQNIDYVRMSRAYMPLPPPEEQELIVRFLNRTNQRIERTIRAKRKVIALLNEQKQVIIHRAVTRGLDPNVRLKPSGIPWLGDIPEGWSISPIKKLLSQMDYGTSEISTVNGKIRILTMGNIQKGEVLLPKSGGLDKVADSLILNHHDLLFTRTNGNPELVGKVGIFRGSVDDKVSFASYLVRFRVKPPHDPQWLHMLLNSSAFWPFARSHALVNLQTNLNSTRYGQFSVPVPPPAEQAKIIQNVINESRTLDTVISRSEHEIDLLREYRTRLIADVVTGKLDVREAAARLPDEVEEVEDVILDDDDVTGEEVADVE